MRCSMLFAITVLAALSGCATYEQYHGREPFTPQPVLSPPGSDINSFGSPYSVPPVTKPSAHQ